MSTTTHCDRCGKEAIVSNLTLNHPEHRVGMPSKVTIQICRQCQEDILAFAQKKPDDWIVWNGGGQDHADGPEHLSIWDKVEIKMRGGATNEGYSDGFVWGHFGSELDIVEYRVTEKDKES